MDCKKALLEPEVTTIEEAIDFLRKQGQLKASTKMAGRDTNSGGVSLSIGTTAASIIEINTETDFVARGERFSELSQSLAISARENGKLDVPGFLESPCGDGTVADAITSTVAVVGENIQVRRLGVIHFDSDVGVISGYRHQALDAAASVCQHGSLVHVQHNSSSLDAEGQAAVEGLAKQLAMHVAASQPTYVSMEQIPEAEVERERGVLTEIAIAEGRPAKIVDRMVEGRLKKFYKELCLLEQPFVLDGKTPVHAVLADAAKTLGVELSVEAFLRYRCGESL